MRLLFLTIRGVLWIDGLLSLALSSCSISICICITSGRALESGTLPTIYNYNKSKRSNPTSTAVHVLTIRSHSGESGESVSRTSNRQTIADNTHPSNQLTLYNSTNTNNTIVKSYVEDWSKEANVRAKANVTATLFGSDSGIVGRILHSAVHSSWLEERELERVERESQRRRTHKKKFLLLRLLGRAEGKFSGIVSGEVTGRKRSGSARFLLRSSGSGSERSRRDAHAYLPADTESSGVSSSSSSASSYSATVSSVTSSDSVGIRLNGGDEEYSSVQDAFVEGSHLWTLLVAGYSLVFTVGVIGNSVLLAALCGSGGRARALPVRNHLMVNLAAADLLVTAICVPISACDAASHACWPGFLVPWMCQLGPLLQRTPVAASTLSLALLSLDRWAAIRHPRFAQRFRERRFVAMSMACIWVLASLVAAPTLWVRQWDDEPRSPWAQEHNSQETSIGSNVTRNSSGTDWGEFESENEWGRNGQCKEGWTNDGMQMAYAATYIGTAFVSPALIVAACHASVSQKLTAQLQVLSGSDRISSRPRPKQVIIVARDLANNPNANANGPLNGNPVAGNLNGHGGVNAGENGGNALPTIVIDPPKPSTMNMKLVPCDPNSDEDDVYLRMQIEADLESFRQLSQMHQNQNNANQGTRRGMKFYRNTGRAGSQAASAPATNGKLGNALRAARRETSIIRAHRRLRKKFNVPSSTANKQPPPLLPTYSSQSFRSRRRAANLLAALAAVFVFCWAPYVLCAICEIFLLKTSWIRLVIPFSLFLGHVHSAINPVVSWRLNRSAFVRFQRQPIFSFLPDWSWLRFCRTCTAPCCCCFCCCPTQCNCNCGRCCSWGYCPGQRHPHLQRTNTRYPHMHNQNNLHPLQQQSRIHSNHQNDRCSCLCCSCCYCPSMFARRRSSSPDVWNRNSSTNEAQLGAFHPKYLSRMPAPDPVSRCHTSHFLR